MLSLKLALKESKKQNDGLKTLAAFKNLLPCPQ